MNYTNEISSRYVVLLYIIISHSKLPLQSNCRFSAAVYSCNRTSQINGGHRDLMTILSLLAYALRILVDYLLHRNVQICEITCRSSGRYWRTQPLRSLNRKQYVNEGSKGELKTIWYVHFIQIRAQSVFRYPKHITTSLHYGRVKGSHIDSYGST